MSSPPRFQHISLVGSDRDARVVESLQMIAAHLIAKDRNVSAAETSAIDFGASPVQRRPEAQLAKHADLIVAVGGDGTMLHAARLASPCDVPVLGVNRGRLGFLADIGPAEVLDRLDQVLAGDYVQDRRAMLNADLIDAQGQTRSCHALNDVVLQKWRTGRMLDFETWIDGRYVNTHGGDGLVVATATGSTAYALSCGGPILYPELDAVVLAPICPHTLSDRPIVVRSDARIEIRLVERPDTQAQVTCDGVSLGEITAGQCLRIARAEGHVVLLHPADHDYFRILRSKLRWGRGDRMPPEETNDSVD
ncbi:MAG TPA: NAD(+) kinase [Steroidobacter sp.]|jgi:NAD+ kinase|nr:NAD(+) kinase [Steroidobacteraceae bacterium]HLS81668.1 NAD(+) kinase [Steroidobacter sp.]